MVEAFCRLFARLSALSVAIQVDKVSQAQVRSTACLFSSIMCAPQMLLSWSVDGWPFRGVDQKSNSNRSG
jgi:hypothetical protein